MKRSPFGASTMLQGSVSEPCAGLPAMPGLPIVIRIRPSRSNFTAVCPAAGAFGYLAFSRGL
jgi:hypothetical protein